MILQAANGIWWVVKSRIGARWVSAPSLVTTTWALPLVPIWSLAPNPPPKNPVFLWHGITFKFLFLGINFCNDWCSSTYRNFILLSVGYIQIFGLMFFQHGYWCFHAPLIKTNILYWISRWMVNVKRVLCDSFNSLDQIFSLLCL